MNLGLAMAVFRYATLCGYNAQNYMDVSPEIKRSFEYNCYWRKVR